MKKRVVLLCFVIIFVFSISSCKDEKNIYKNEEETIIPLKELDLSQKKSDINNIESEDISEARIYWGNEVYYTKNLNIIEEIKHRIAELKLTEISRDDLDDVEGFYELYLIEDDKIIYDINSSNALYIGKKCYGPDEAQRQFDTEVIGYCRETFWN